MFFNVVGVGLGLFSVKGILCDLDFLLTGECFERNTCKRSSGGSDLNQSDFPKFNIVFKAYEGRGKNQGVAGRISWRCGVERVSGDECSHAFSIPDDFGFWMSFPDELGEGIEIVIPLGGMSDVAAPFADGIAALTT